MGVFDGCVRFNMGVQGKMQQALKKSTDKVLLKPKKSAIISMMVVGSLFPGFLFGSIELKMTKIVLPQDAREIETEQSLAKLYGDNMGVSSFIVEASDGTDVLSAVPGQPGHGLLDAVAALEARVLKLTAVGVSGNTVTLDDICFKLSPATGCLYTGVLSAGTPWNPQGGMAPNTSLAALRGYSAGSELQTVGEAYNSAFKKSLFMAAILGGVTKDAASGNITAVKSLLLTYYMQGEKRDSLSFRFWNIFGNIPDRSDTEKWEQAFLEFGEANEQFQGLTVKRGTTRSQEDELLQLALSGLPLTVVCMNLMIGYVAWVFHKGPWKMYGASRIKLGLLGVVNVQTATMCGLGLGTLLQIPVTFATQFVFFLVLGIGLDGVFLLVDTYDHAPKQLDAKQRVTWAVAHAGPSIVLASATDILAFLSAATVPIPAIQYFCLSCGICLFVNLGLVLTFFVSVLYMVEHGREKRNKEELGADELAQLRASVGLSNGSKFCINLGELLTRGWCKALVMIVFVALFAFAPNGVSKNEPGFGPADFIKGCGIMCDPSYYLAYFNTLVDDYDVPRAVTHSAVNLDINKDFAEYTALMSKLASSSASGCPVSCMDTSIDQLSWFNAFCASKGGCSAATAWTAQDVKTFLAAAPMFTLDVILPSDLTSSTLSASRTYFAMRDYEKVSDSIEALKGINAAIDSSTLKDEAYSVYFPALSMFNRMMSITWVSLGGALAIAFVVMLLSVHVYVAVIITLLVVAVDLNLWAAIHYFGYELGPFSFATLIISVGLSIDYSIHVGQEFLMSDKPTGNERMKETVGRVGRAVFNGSFTTVLGLAVLGAGPGKPFYSFSQLFCYMVLLAQFHGLFVLPVLLSWVNPPSIASILASSSHPQDALDAIAQDKDPEGPRGPMWSPREAEGLELTDVEAETDGNAKGFTTAKELAEQGWEAREAEEP